MFFSHVHRHSWAFPCFFSASHMNLLFLQIHIFFQQCPVSLPPALIASQSPPRPQMRSPPKPPGRRSSRQYNTDSKHLSVGHDFKLLLWASPIVPPPQVPASERWWGGHQESGAQRQRQKVGVVRFLATFQETSSDWSLNVLHLNHRFEELTNIIKTIRNAMKIRDMAKCLEEFEQLCRAFLKSKNIVDKEGVPSFYIRILADLEDYLNTVSTSRWRFTS